jgi:hypothetical protein
LNPGDATTAAPIPVAAQLAPDEENDVERRNNVPTYEAREIKAPEEEPWLSKRRNKLVVLIILLLVIAVSVTVSLLVSGVGDGQDKSEYENASGSSQEPYAEEAYADVSPAPSTSPTTAAPTSFYENILASVSEYSGTTVLEDQNSPQYKGLQWVYGDITSNNSEEPMSDTDIMERFALSVLYYSTAGGRWATVIDFLVPSDHCMWDAIECDGDGKLINITLVNENLSGSLPPEIGLLSSLKTLNLQGNRLTGSLPSEVGYLTNLVELIVPGVEEDRVFINPSRLLQQGDSDHNEITGSIPSEIGLLRSLSVLKLHGNRIEGAIPTEIGLLSDLEFLSLHNNPFLEGDIPLQIGFLTELKYLSLDRTSLSGTIPNALCSTVSLLEEVSGDCLDSTPSLKDAEIGCKCCNICCDKNNRCVDVDVTASPSTRPSTSPTPAPSNQPSKSPTLLPSSAPSGLPSISPSHAPSPAPSPSGTPEPTATPSKLPTFVPTSSPTMTLSPTISSCSIDESSCSGNRACNGAIELCTQAGSCTGRNACRDASNLQVDENSCVGDSSCRDASGRIERNSCTDNSACSGFQGVSIGSNSCNVSCNLEKCYMFSSHF